MKGSRRDVIAGITFIAFGLAFAAGGTAFPIGSAARMGPGFFPILVGGVLVVLGLMVAIRLDAEGDAAPATAPAWRGLVLLIGAIVFFAVTVRGLGLVPALLVTVLASAMGSRQTSPVGAAALAVGLTALSVLIFVVGLRLNVPLLGTWLPRL